jgi:hypothetical protein
MIYVFTLNSIIKGLKTIRSLYFKKFPPSLTHCHANPKALKELVLTEAQTSGFNVIATRGSSIVCGKLNPPTCSKKNSDFLRHSRGGRLSL